MLESLKSKTLWNWYIDGKHPVASDFLELGVEDSLLKAFIDWTAAGYQQLIAGQGSPGGDRSWRFWLNGQKKGTLICGVSRDSSDRIGRHHPLIIIGSGHLNNWESNWDLVPYALEDIWGRIEYLACGRFNDVGQLKDGLGHIKKPSSDWLALANQRATDGTMNASIYVARDPHAMGRHVLQLINTGSDVVELNPHAGTDPFFAAGYWIFALKAHVKFVPTAVFMGGIPEKSFLVIFNRSLTTEDFVRLWSITSQSNLTRN
jgi:type VI secretion system protein VasJ